MFEGKATENIEEKSNPILFHRISGRRREKLELSFLLEVLLPFYLL